MENYVDKAEEVMLKIGIHDKKNQGKYNFSLTTSKIRNILAYVSEIYNVENLRKEESLSTESEAKIQSMRVRIIYEAGRENAVAEFVKEAKILEDIKSIGTSREGFIKFARYMEALVAYHRYLGGRDN